MHVKRQVLKKTIMNPELDCKHRLFDLTNRLPQIKEVDDEQSGCRLCNMIHRLGIFPARFPAARRASQAVSETPQTTIDM